MFFDLKTKTFVLAIFPIIACFGCDEVDAPPEPNAAPAALVSETKPAQAQYDAFKEDLEKALKDRFFWFDHGAGHFGLADKIKSLEKLPAPRTLTRSTGSWRHLPTCPSPAFCLTSA